MDWSLYLPLGFGGVLFVIALINCIYLNLMKKRFTWLYRGKLLVAEVKIRSAKLYLDGNLVDEFSGTNVRRCMLRAPFEGEEVLIRIRFGFSPKAEALAGGKPIERVVA